MFKIFPFPSNHWSYDKALSSNKWYVVNDNNDNNDNNHCNYITKIDIYLILAKLEIESEEYKYKIKNFCFDGKILISGQRENIQNFIDWFEPYLVMYKLSGEEL